MARSIGNEHHTQINNEGAAAQNKRSPDIEKDENTRIDGVEPEVGVAVQNKRGPDIEKDENMIIDGVEPEGGAAAQEEENVNANARDDEEGMKIDVSMKKPQRECAETPSADVSLDEEAYLQAAAQMYLKDDEEEQQMVLIEELVPNAGAEITADDGKVTKLVI
ncbi:hypothetical protein BDN70DRAFT_940205 [Pholiota conissans]|uniref:Uncharacterized protein n=1 Tax=Pholiota conissans TaxID=109636 RepID=A0A9P5YIN7_9AGAR|nr:hypothetical protein BDN70DRAFT_940205 [Pholiota conissans]